MNTVVNQIHKIKGVYRTKKINPTLLKKRRPRTKKEAAYQQEVERVRLEKQILNAEKNVGKIVKDQKKAIKTHSEDITKKRERATEINSRIEAGHILPTKRMIGSRKYTARAQIFQDMDEVVPELSKTGANLEPLREQFDGIYRRGLLEPRKNASKRKNWRMAKVRFRNNPNKSWKVEHGRKQEKFDILK